VGRPQATEGRGDSDGFEKFLGEGQRREKLTGVHIHLSLPGKLSSQGLQIPGTPWWAVPSSRCKSGGTHYD